jgi:epoxide hydrolase 4
MIDVASLRVPATQEPFQSTYVPNGGLSLHCVSAGRGKTVLFLHGFPEFWYAWKEPMLRLADDFQVVAPDLRGYPPSSCPEGKEHYRISALLGDILRVIEHFSPEAPPVVVGHDWGGVLAWFLAAYHPEKVDRLVILNAPHPVLFRREILTNPRQALASSYAFFFQLPWLPERLLKAFDCRALRKGVLDGARDEAAFLESDRKAYLSHWREKDAVTKGLEYYRANPFLTLTEGKMPPIRVPTKVIWGEKDAVLGVGNLEGLDRYVPDLQIERLPEASHWLVHEQPALVSSLISEFAAKKNGSGKKAAAKGRASSPTRSRPEQAL